jgi:hypothetical protein
MIPSARRHSSHQTNTLYYQSFYSPTDAQEICFKNIKIYIKTAPTVCAATPAN